LSFCLFFFRIIIRTTRVQIRLPLIINFSPLRCDFLAIVATLSPRARAISFNAMRNTEGFDSAQINLRNSMKFLDLLPEALTVSLEIVHTCSY
jgi:hypothetical protein